MRVRLHERLSCCMEWAGVFCKLQHSGLLTQFGAKKADTTTHMNVPKAKEMESLTPAAAAPRFARLRAPP